MDLSGLQKVKEHMNDLKNSINLSKIDRPSIFKFFGNKMWFSHTNIYEILVKLHIFSGLFLQAANKGFDHVRSSNKVIAVRVNFSFAKFVEDITFQKSLVIWGFTTWKRILQRYALCLTWYRPMTLAALNALKMPVKSIIFWKNQTMITSTTLEFLRR